MPARSRKLHAQTFAALLSYLALSALGCGDGGGGAAPKASPFQVGSTASPPPPPPPAPAVAQSSARATVEPTEAESPAVDTSAAPASDQLALGKQVFENQKCGRCHRMEEGGPGGPGPGFGGPPPGGPPPGGFGGPKGGPGGRGPGGPSLAHVGSKPDRTAQWLADHVRDPKSHNPGSRMPSFGPDKISDPDLAALGEYLASLK